MEVKDEDKFDFDPLVRLAPAVQRQCMHLVPGICTINVLVSKAPFVGWRLPAGLCSESGHHCTSATPHRIRWSLQDF